MLLPPFLQPRGWPCVMLCNQIDPDIRKFRVMKRMLELNRLLAIGVASMALVLAGPAIATSAKDEDKSKSTQAKPALTVNVTSPRQEMWGERIKASGRVLPWQDVVVAAETGGLRVIDVRAEVGDVVKKGQVLAALAPDVVRIDIAKAEARVAQAEAKLEEAGLNANRGRTMRTTGALSSQQLDEYRILEQMAQSSLALEAASLAQEKLRLSQTTIVAPDNGVVSSRNASLGQVVQPGTELYRLIRQSRLVWLAEVSADQLPAIRLGQRAEVTLPGGIRSGGAVRRISPELDESSLNALVSVTLDDHAAIRSGMFGSGDILVGEQPAMTLPESAIAWRDGKSYLFVLDRAKAPDLRVVRHQAVLGRRYNGRVELLSVLPADAEVVESGAAFLSEGDVVRLADPAVAAQH